MSARRVGPRDDGAPLTRAEMAKARGISKSTLRRWEAAGKVKPIVDERGFHLYRQEDARFANGVNTDRTAPQGPGEGALGLQGLRGERAHAMR